LTTSITSSELVISKFISTLVPLVFSLFLGLLFPITIYIFGDPELGPIITGFFGLFLLTLALCGIGVFLSLRSPNQTIAGVFGLIIGVLWLLLDLPLLSLDGDFILFIRDLSLAPRLEGFFKGIISFLDVFFFIAVTILFLTLSSQSLSIQREE
jgi:ABC-2 type transport system permease protein